MQANIDRQSMIMSWENLNQVKVVTAATALAVHERFVIINSGAIMNLTLPYVAEARGLEYDLWFRTDGGDVTVVDRGDSIGWANVVIANAGSHALLRSDGVTWHVVRVGT